MKKTDCLQRPERLIAFCLWLTLVFVPLFPLVFRFLPAQIYINSILFKAIALRLIGLVILIAWLKILLTIERSSLRLPFFKKPVLLYLLTGFLAMTFSILPHLSFYGDRSSYHGFLSALLAMVFFWATFRFGKQRAGFFLTSLIVSSVLLSAFGLMEKLYPSHGGSSLLLGRIESSFSSPIAFGAFLSLLFPIITVHLLFRRDSKGNGAFVWIAWSLNLTALILTFTWSAWFACLGGFAMLAFLLKKYLRPGLLSSVRLKAITISLIVLFALVFLSFPFAKTKTISLQGRSIIWRLVFQAVQERPLLGSGPDTLLFIAPRFQENNWELIAGIPSSTRFAHNLFLHAASTEGLLGFLSSVFFLTTFVLLALKRLPRLLQRDTGLVIALLSGIFAFVIHSLFAWSDWDTTVVFWVIFALAASLLCPEESRPTFGKIRSSFFRRPLLRYAFDLSALLVLIVSIWSGIKPLAADHFFLRSLRTDLMTSRLEAEKKIKTAIKLDPAEWRYRLLLARYYLLPPMSLKRLDQAQKELEISLESNPYDYDTIDLLIAVLEEKKKRGQACEEKLEQTISWGRSVYPLHPAFKSR